MKRPWICALLGVSAVWLGEVSLVEAQVLTAVFDPVLQAPKCATVGQSCDTGASLVLGRDGKGPEPNHPNTINDQCPDGTQGAYHVDESNDRLKVSTVDGTTFAAGKQVRISATVWAWTTPSSDRLDLYYAANASAPVWTFVGTIVPGAVGPQMLSMTYTLPSGSLQAVRAQFRYLSTSANCNPGAYNDRDDLVFAVGPSRVPPDLTATFDAALQAPRCATVGRSCDSGPSLLLGRDEKGPEPNEPNTIGDSCADGTSGVFHVDESNDRIRVSTLDGGFFAAGKQVKVEATVWAWTTPASDHLDVYVAGNANNPVWTFVGSVTPTAAGSQTLNVIYVLPAGTLQAVRARYRYQGAAGSCITGSYDDHDDLVFASQ